MSSSCLDKSSARVLAGMGSQLQRAHQIPLLLLLCCCMPGRQTPSNFQPSHASHAHFVLTFLPFHLLCCRQVWLLRVMCSLAAMQSTPCAHQHASSSSCRRPRISHRQSLIPAVQGVVLHRQVCSAAGAAAGSSTAQVLPAQHGRQQQQHHILSQQKHQCQEQSALVARQTHNIDSNSSSSSTPSQKHSSKRSASGRSASARLSLQQLQALLRQRPAPERPALLTCCIKACASWQQAALLFADHSHEFNAVHTAALISHLPKVRLAAAACLVGPRKLAAAAAFPRLQCLLMCTSGSCSCMLL